MALEPVRTFITVVEEKNFTRAAQKLRISQPSVSLHIKQLEEEFNTILIDRSQRFLHLTETGAFFYKRAKEIVEHYDQSIEDIARMNQRVEGALSIGASYTIGEFVLPTLLAPFQKSFPAVELTMSIENTTNIVENVYQRVYTMGFVEGHVQHPQLDVIPMMEDEMVLIAPNDLADRLDAPVTKEQLSQWSWVQREEGSGTRAYMDDFLKNNDIHVSQKTTISSNYGVKEAVANGLGLSILSKWVVQKALQHKEISIVPMIDWPATKRHFYLILPKAPKTLLVDAFINHLKTSIEQQIKTTP
ncbi:LysR family transcriptional regulator [Bacillaceae bacterium SIJ1]|uniref:LysR family transcriptional regulator n=1 Tax=Litoribacterium kuwaitense TaxID=1398745 RepID=UPI0013EB6E55|nr:LysR family transcriptional regulator [Litoribacterium kuwaitense]NGP46681.1 LysR family transcriptional regulator [Litoribacterium kuwaitense]